jgi:hypothetical protein
MVQVVVKKLVDICKKIWSNDAKIGCTSSTSLIELIEMNLKLEEKLEKLEDAFERDELWTCK